ncbi:leucine-rich repeat-containing protein 15 [Fopius arisanus]|uniref:Leucine-rich repeat-containing protein 15 n=2 Tax=Fopius arisanus TaxID=64838 RepID=A0A9R1TPL9_9HYME|nr:PREDICTED: leucine-rich repeat-containing protein 15 [Fopius arisanus]
METSATFVVLICALMSSLIEANSNYDGTFEYCNKTGPTSETCKPWNSSAIVEIETQDVYQKGIPNLKLYFKEDSSQEFRKLNLTEGAYSRFNISTSLVFDGVNIDGASGPFINQDKITAICLKNNSLQEFPRDFFRGISNLTYVEVSGQNFSTLSKHLLSEISNDIVALRLMKNSVTNIESEAFSNFPKLKYLLLSNNRLTELQPNMFSGLDSLEVLELDGNKITTVQPGTFGSLLQLRWMSLKDNLFESLPDDIFTGLSLQLLEFSGNWTEDSCQSLFENLDHLVFGICGDVIISKETSVFRSFGVKKKSEMETSATFIVLICALMSSLIEANSNYDGTFEYCNKTGPTSEICKPWNSSAIVEIETEDLYEEGIPTLNLYFKEDSSQEFRKLNLTEGAYSRFNLSTSLVFDGVNIDGASGPFINQDKITAISLINNGLQEFPRDFFRGISNLIYVHVFGQNCPTLSKHLLSEISNNIVTLRLVQNSVTNIEAEAFSNFRKLKYLVLSNNRLTELQPDMFSGLDSLEVLELDGNKIITVQPGTFASLLKLRWLFLRDNLFESLPDDIFTGLRLQLLNFSGNWTEDRCQSLLEHLDHLRTGTCGDIIITKYTSIMRF